MPVPLRWVLVQPAHLNDSAVVGGVFFWRRVQSAAEWQIKTALCSDALVVLPGVTTETDTHGHKRIGARIHPFVFELLSVVDVV